MWSRDHTLRTTVSADRRGQLTGEVGEILKFLFLLSLKRAVQKDTSHHSELNKC